MRKNKFLLVAVGLMLVGSLLSGSAPTQAIGRDALQRGLRAAVKLLILDANTEVTGTCSGTVLNQEGYILTNFHCVGQTDIYGEDPELNHGDLYHPEGLLGVAITENPRYLPAPKYIAQYRAGNPDQDVAVIKIISDLEANVVPDTLPLVSAMLVDSDAVEIGEEVNVLGYPGVGGDTVTFTEGKISGFIDEDRDNLTDWFKTDALVNGGNSGGSAVNESGNVVGIPSMKIAGADTLYFIKPVNQAMPVIERAYQVSKSDGAVGGGSTGSVEEERFSGGQNFGEMTFGTGFVDDEVTGAATEFASGVTEIHAAIPYQNMRDGTSWGYIWQYEGQDNVGETGLRWDMGKSGVLNLYLSSDEGLPDGDFNLQVLIKDRIVQEGQFLIGSADPTEADTPRKPDAEESEGVFLTGRIIDYDTAAPIEDALVLFLLPGVTVDDFDAADYPEELLQSMGVTDADGMYFTILPLPRGQDYTVIIGREGYQRIAENDVLEVYADAEELVELPNISLERE